VVQGIGRDRQAPALDRVGEDHDRAIAVVVSLVQRAEHRAEIMSADVGDDRRKLLIGHVAEQAIEIGIDERLAHRRRRQSDESLVLAVRHRLEAATQRLAAALPEHRGRSPAPAQIDHPPAERAEQRGQLVPARVGHDAIETLPVDVHDPHDVAESPEHLLGEGLPDVALVELGIAHHHDHALGRAVTAVIRDVLRGQRAEARLDGAQSHRARGDFHDARILAPARIGLQATEHTKVAERARVEPPAQVLNGVECRRSMGLHSNGVTGTQRFEVEGGEQRHHGSGRRLVAADLDTVLVGPNHVGVVHHEGPEPQYPALDAIEDFEVRHGRA